MNRYRRVVTLLVVLTSSSARIGRVLQAFLNVPALPSVQMVVMN